MSIIDERGPDKFNFSKHINKRFGGTLVALELNDVVCSYIGYMTPGYAALHPFVASILGMIKNAGIDIVIITDVLDLTARAQINEWRLSNMIDGVYAKGTGSKPLKLAQFLKSRRYSRAFYFDSCSDAIKDMKLRTNRVECVHIVADRHYGSTFVKQIAKICNSTMRDFNSEKLLILFDRILDNNCGKIPYPVKQAVQNAFTVYSRYKSFNGLIQRLNYIYSRIHADYTSDSDSDSESDYDL